MTAREAIKLLISAGFVAKTGGKHRQFEKNGRKVAVPTHGSKDLSRKVVATIMAAIEAERG